MLKFDEKLFNDFIIKNNVIKFSEKKFRLKSGRRVNEYIDWSVVNENTNLIDMLSDFIINFAKQKFGDFDTFYGVPEGATKIALITQFKWGLINKNFKGGHSLPMGRAKPKYHGILDNRFFIGLPKGRVIVIEDFTTTGESLISTLDQLKDEGVNVLGVIIITDRCEKRNDGNDIKRIILERGYDFYSMSNSNKIIPLAYKKFIKENGEIKKQNEK